MEYYYHYQHNTLVNYQLLGFWYNIKTSRNVSKGTVNSTKFGPYKTTVVYEK